VSGNQCKLEGVRRDQPFAVGDPVVWRSRPAGDVGYVYGCRVWIEEPHVAALVQPTGSPILRRSARRSGPNGRSFLPGTRDGARQASTWDRPPTVRLHPVGRSYSVIRNWLAGDQRFDGWYVNLEQPWRRTTVGFDSRDDVLDITLADDLTEWHLKDADELEFAVQTGQLTDSEQQGIRAVAESAVDDIIHRRWPFDDSTWAQGLPGELLEPVSLPDQWDEP
jgi:hypothetical protein